MDNDRTDRSLIASAIDGFSAAAFSDPDSIPALSSAYVLCWESQGQAIPFYVGQTENLSIRMMDYRAGQFAAPTDFRVAEAIRYFRDMKCEIGLRYKPSANPRSDERTTIRKLQLCGVRLLNEFLGYDWKAKDRKQEEAEAIRKFCAVLIGSKSASPAMTPLPVGGRRVDWPPISCMLI